MDKTKKILAIAGLVITMIGAIFGGESTNWTFDFSQDHSINISDDDTTTINEGDTILGIDREDIKDVACDLAPELCD